MGGASLVGGSVRRTAGEWSPTIQRLLRHLRDRGIAWVPVPSGVDAQGRDRVSYLPGVVPRYPLPDWVWSDTVLTGAASKLAALHEASAGFDRDAAVWRTAAHAPAEVICHNDFAPYNMVFQDGRLTGVIDWDTASPGPRVWDVAYLAYRLVPLTDPANPDGVRNGDDNRARRLRQLCDTYGHGLDPPQVLAAAVARLHDLAGFTEARAAGRPDLLAHAVLYRRDAAWIEARSGTPPAQ
ncbi:aminoglycoside phosphotransferase family protein [Actinoplanes sp. TBRC 11911]|nr:aminoglycoside phosphotransferase family protein [Actinoplanes sp. TBRC 11911]